MKNIKLIFSCIISLIFLISCSNNDDNCSNEVYGLNRACIPLCTYTVTYGPNEDNLTTIETNKATYDYYREIVNDENELDCWEGEK
jgi:hypothetical protein